MTINRMAIACVLVTATVMQGCSSSNSYRETDICETYDWSRVEKLVQPYLDDFWYTHLVMQGQSSNYRSSEAARQVMAYGQPMPEEVKKILRTVIRANC